MGEPVLQPSASSRHKGRARSSGPCTDPPPSAEAAVQRAWDRKQTYQRGRSWGGGINWELGINRCTLLYTYKITRTYFRAQGTVFQYPVITYNRKEIHMKLKQDAWNTESATQLGLSHACTLSRVRLSRPYELCSPPGSSIHGILKARVPEWVAISFSRGSARPGDRTHVSCISRWILYHWATRQACTSYFNLKSLKKKSSVKHQLLRWLM